MKIRCIKNQDGVTILEVLIAMIILSLALLLLLNMAMVALDGNDWANNMTVATPAHAGKTGAIAWYYQSLRWR